MKQFRLNDALDAALKNLKYLLLLGLIAVTIFVPNEIDTAAEVEPFKTAITVFFIREWYYVLYAVLCLGLGMFVYKGFCRYVCPLGAAMAIGGFSASDHGSNDEMIVVHPANCARSNVSTIRSKRVVKSNIQNVFMP